MNSHTISGITKYVKHGSTKTGKGMITFTVCVDSPQLGVNGVPRQNWFQVIAFGRAAEMAAMLENDQTVIVAGEGNIDTWVDSKDNTEKKIYKITANTIEVVFTKDATPKPAAKTDDFDDELPELKVTSDPFEDE